MIILYEQDEKIIPQNIYWYFYEYIQVYFVPLIGIILSQMQMS